MFDLLKKVTLSLFILTLIITGCVNKSSKNKNSSQSIPASSAIDNLALTPPMGWNS